MDAFVAWLCAGEAGGAITLLDLDLRGQELTGVTSAAELTNLKKDLRGCKSGIQDLLTYVQKSITEIERGYKHEEKAIKARGENPPTPSPSKGPEKGGPSACLVRVGGSARRGHPYLSCKRLGRGRGRA